MLITTTEAFIAFRPQMLEKCQVLRELFIYFTLNGQLSRVPQLTCVSGYRPLIFNSTIIIIQQPGFAIV